MLDDFEKTIGFDKYVYPSIEKSLYAFISILQKILLYGDSYKWQCGWLTSVSK